MSQPARQEEEAPAFCRQCGYDLTSLHGSRQEVRCPECGARNVPGMDLLGPLRHRRGTVLRWVLAAVWPGPVFMAASIAFLSGGVEWIALIMLGIGIGVSLSWPALVIRERAHRHLPVTQRGRTVVPLILLAYTLNAVGAGLVLFVVILAGFP